MQAEIWTRLARYFGLESLDGDPSETFYAVKGEGTPRFLVDTTQSGSYERYTISSPLLVSLTHKSPNDFTSVYLDYHSQFFVREPPNSSNAPQLHKHNYFELVYLCEGQMDLSVENTRYRMQPGEACIINTNVRHQELQSAEHTVLYIGIIPENMPVFSSLMQKSKGSLLNDFFLRNRHETNSVEYLYYAPLDSFRNGESLSRLNDLPVALIRELLLQEAGYQMLCEVAVIRLFDILQNPAAYMCSNTRFQILNGDTLFEKTLRYLNEKKHKLNRADLERDLLYNGAYINRVFLKKTGQTLAKYNRDVCMTEAARRLLNTADSVQEICHAIGYENKTAFYQCFHKKYGVTPQQYRDMRYQNQTAQRDDALPGANG